VVLAQDHAFQRLRDGGRAALDVAVRPGGQPRARLLHATRSGVLGDRFRHLRPADAQFLRQLSAANLRRRSPPPWPQPAHGPGRSWPLDQRRGRTAPARPAARPPGRQERRSGPAGSPGGQAPDAQKSGLRRERPGRRC
jgi:hypothetical protein